MKALFTILLLIAVASGSYIPGLDYGDLGSSTIGTPVTATLFVSAGGDNSDGSTWDKAYTTLNGALDVTASTGVYYGISYSPVTDEYANSVAIYAHKVAADVPMTVSVYESHPYLVDPIWDSSMFKIAESDTTTINTAIWGMREFVFDNPLYLESGKVYVFLFNDLSFGQYKARLCHAASTDPYCFTGSMGGFSLQADDPAAWLMTDSCTRYDYLMPSSGKSAAPWPVFFPRILDEENASIYYLHVDYLHTDTENQISILSNIYAAEKLEIVDTLTVHGPVILPNTETALNDDTLITAGGDSLFVSGGMVWKFVVGP